MTGLLNSMSAGSTPASASSVELGGGGDLEAAAEAVQLGQDLRVRVALHRVVHGEPRQARGDRMVLRGHPIEVDEQLRRSVVVLHPVLPSTDPAWSGYCAS